MFLAHFSGPPGECGRCRRPAPPGVAPRVRFFVQGFSEALIWVGGTYRKWSEMGNGKLGHGKSPTCSEIGIGRKGTCLYIYDDDDDDDGLRLMSVRTPFLFFLTNTFMHVFHLLPYELLFFSNRIWSPAYTILLASPPRRPLNSSPVDVPSSSRTADWQ